MKEIETYKTKLEDQMKLNNDKGFKLKEIEDKQVMSEKDFNA